MTPPSDPPGRRFFFLVFAGAAVLLALVVRPLATPLFLATVLAVVLWPLYRRLAAALGGRATLASGLIVLAVVLVLVAPLVAFSAFIVKEGKAGLEFVSQQASSESVSALVAKLPEPIRKPATGMLSRLSEPVDGTQVAEQVGAAAKATGSVLFVATMMLIALFFLLLHADELTEWLDRVLPLPRGQTRELLSEFKNVSSAVVISTVVTAGVQALAALAGYFIAQVPHPLFFGGVTFFVACIPAIGAASVCLAAALLLFTTGHPYAALFLAIWGVTVVGLVDNLVKPLLIRSGMKMSGAIVFFALMGGLAAFGAAGLLIGPLAVSLFLALLHIYQRDYKRPPRTPGRPTAVRPRAGTAS